MAKKNKKKVAKKATARKSKPTSAKASAGKKVAKKVKAKTAKKKTVLPAGKAGKKVNAKKTVAVAKPKKITTVNTYLTFNGNCEDAFNFYKSVFGGNFTYVGRYKDMPPSEGQHVDTNNSDGEKIMHVSLPISNETILMGCDSAGEYAASTTVGNNFSLSISPENEAEATRLFNQLAEGGRVNMPLAKTFWGAYFGMLTDKYGINWMVNYEYNAN